uniref:Uncharacterized protein n=1 Tax=Myoviridae sp. ct0wg9 TaxID=2826600 RepID=A0A8S5NF60_9CAUD|nr:MAG TPA: hypothetical protein [Myoviridae sp. ct0wg9]
MICKQQGPSRTVRGLLSSCNTSMLLLFDCD